jgi:parallel beta-helix repeat protein
MGPQNSSADVESRPIMLALKPFAVACAAACAAIAIQAGATAAEAGTVAPALPRTVTVTNLRNSGPGSLRAAIHVVNASPPAESSTIRFWVRGVITLTRSLPAVYRKVAIDGTSAPGYSGRPLVELNCNGRAGLDFAPGSAGSQLLGLAVDNAGGDGVTLNASKITLNADYIGLDLAGRPAGNRGDGVYVSPASSRNRIGLNRAAAVGVVANVISANGWSGLVLAGSSGNTVVSNRIGTNRGGGSAIGNGGAGILITGRSNGNEIGGTAFVDKSTGQANNPTGNKGTTTPVIVVPPLGNLVSGNRGSGIIIASRSQGNVLNGNFVGTTANGDSALGNGGNGVWINDANNNSLVGCKFVNNPFVYYNVVSGNRANGVRITNSNNSVVQGNFFGVGANNTTLLGNRFDGILVEGTSGNTQVGGVIPLGNVSAGNGTNGIEVTDRAHGFITFNTFGGLLAFKGAAPNGNDGVLITSTGGDNTIRTNVLSGNRHNGIELAGNATGVTVDPNIAGLNTKGNGTLPNGRDGLLIDGNAHGNTIGGTLRSVIPQNTFSGNARYGVQITGWAHDNLVFRSYIGTTLLGVTALGNQRGGVVVGGHAYLNAIGNFSSRPSNIISGNRGNGVTLLYDTRLNRVVNNYIGRNRLGIRLPNTGRPILNLGRLNVILANRT